MVEKAVSRRMGVGENFKLQTANFLRRHYRGRASEGFKFQIVPKAFAESIRGNIERNSNFQRTARNRGSCRKRTQRTQRKRGEQKGPRIPNASRDSGWLGGFDHHLIVSYNFRTKLYV